MTTHHLPCKHCNSKDGLSEYVDSIHCFSCGYHKSTGKQRLRTEHSVPVPKELPKKSTSDSTSALIWLHTNGITNELQDKYNIYLSALPFNRVIIPSTYKDELLGWQGRAIELDQHPKYIQGAGQKPELFYSHSLREGQEVDVVAIVEDALSAIRLGEFLPTVALLGSKLDSQGKQLARLIEVSNNFCIWMDDDKAGQEGAAQIVQRLGMVGEVLNLRNELEPKQMADDDLKIAAQKIKMWFAQQER